MLWYKVSLASELIGRYKFKTEKNKQDGKNNWSQFRAM